MSSDSTFRRRLPSTWPRNHNPIWYICWNNIGSAYWGHIHRWSLSRMSGFPVQLHYPPSMRFRHCSRTFALTICRLNFMIFSVAWEIQYHASGFLPTIKYIGVNTPFLPPRTRPSPAWSALQLSWRFLLARIEQILTSSQEASRPTSHTWYFATPTSNPVILERFSHRRKCDTTMAGDPASVQDLQ